MKSLSSDDHNVSDNSHVRNISISEYYGVIVYIAIHVILSLCHIQSKIFNMNKPDFVGSVTLLSS